MSLPGSQAPHDPLDGFAFAPSSWTLDDYQHFLGRAYAVLCAATLLPRLSPAGVVFLAERVETGAPAEQLAQLCGISWVADGRWPRALRAEFAQELKLMPLVREQAERAIADYLQRTTPREGTGAWYEHQLLMFEQALHGGSKSASALFKELANGPLHARSLLRHSPVARGWARRHRVRSLPTESRYALVVAASLLVSAWFLLAPREPPERPPSALTLPPVSAPATQAASTPPATDALSPTAKNASSTSSAEKQPGLTVKQARRAPKPKLDFPPEPTALDYPDPLKLEQAIEEWVTLKEKLQRAADQGHMAVPSTRRSKTATRQSSAP